MRLETEVSDGGAGLSGGQVQRLLLARALYRAPRILFLDEATNQLDRQTERRVLSNLAALSITIVSIAHSANALEQSGRIIHL
jgi:ATP-binding cassette subfamily B protein RaxB